MRKVLHLGQFHRPSDFEWWISVNLALRGHSVTRIQQTPDGWPHEEIFRAIFEQRYDMLLFHKAPGCNPDKLARLKIRFPEMKVCMWTPDWRRHPSWAVWYKPLGEICDWTFATDGPQECEWWSERGVRSHPLRQACWPMIHHPMEVEPVYDVGFFGSLYTDGRQRIHTALKEAFGDRYCYRGNACPQDEAWADEFRHSIASCKVIVGDNHVNDIEGYWSDRVFLTQACGGFMLHPDVQGYDLSPTYKRNNPDECVKQIHYWLANEEERKTRAKLGYERCVTHDTYQHRLDEMEKVLGW